MPSGMQHGCYFYNLHEFINFINNPVGKMIRITPADIFGRVTPAVEQWVFSQRIPNTNNLFNKLRAQTGLAGFIPIRGRRNIGFDFRGELDAPVHL